MRIREDFVKLMERFEKESNKQGGKIDLLELFKESLRLFEKLKDILGSCSEEEKKEVFAVMAEMHQFLLKESKKIAERSGMSEDQLLRFSENPDNFTPNQWKALEVIKVKLNDTAKDLTKIIRKETTKEVTEKKKTTSSVAKRPRAVKKDNWTRS